MSARTDRIAAAEDAIEAAKRKVEKLEAFLDGAHDGVKVAEEELAAAIASPEVPEEPFSGERVVARVQ